MSLNLSELQQKANQVLFNSDEAIRKWVEFISAPAGNVSFQYYDRNGNLQQVNFDNRNKLVQNFISNVNSAMSKTFYVDPINGNDANDGSQANPFKTIKKAIDSVPVGGYADIYLIQGQTYNIDSDIYIYNKVIFIYGNYTNKPILNFSNTIRTRGYSTFYIENSIIEANNSNLTFRGYSGTSVGIKFNACIINVNNYNFIDLGNFQNNLVYLGGTTININGTGKFINMDAGGLLSLALYNNTIKDSNGNALTWSDVISGIVRDSNGVPRNVASNIVL